MSFKVRLNPKFYIVSILLFCLVVFVWYGVYFINTGRVLMEDNTPMDKTTKTIFTVFIGVIALSWTISLLALIRQMIIGSAFSIDENGIHTTLTAMMLLAFIFVVPIKKIPYDAILNISEENGVVILKFDKSKIEASPLFLPFVRNEFRFFLGFTKESQSDIKEVLDKYIDKK